MANPYGIYSGVVNNGAFQSAAPSYLSPVTMAMLGMDTSKAGSGQQYNTGTGQWEAPTGVNAGITGARVGPPGQTNYASAANPGQPTGVLGGGTSNLPGFGPQPPPVNPAARNYMTKPLQISGGGGGAQPNYNFFDILSHFQQMFGNKGGGGVNTSAPGASMGDQGGISTLPYRIPQGMQDLATNYPYQTNQMVPGSASANYASGDTGGVGGNTQTGSYGLNSMAMGNRPNLRSVFAGPQRDTQYQPPLS
jgi:hypothetical protein